MNRMEEYQALLAELEQTPEALESTVSKALTRRNALQKRWRIAGTSLGSLAACFAGFVLLVNLSVPFARACGHIPVLADLAIARGDFEQACTAGIDPEELARYYATEEKIRNNIRRALQ